MNDETIQEVNHVLTNEAFRRDMVAHNYDVARRFFGLGVVEQELRFSVMRPQNIYRLLGQQRRGVAPPPSRKPDMSG